MKIAMIVVRVLMGLLLLFASVSYFLFIFKITPAPQTPMSAAAKTYNEGLAAVNLITIVKVIELLCAIAFLTGRFVKLAIVMLAPIAVNIVIFHANLAPSAIAPGLFLLLGDLFLAWYYRSAYAPIFAAK